MQQQQQPSEASSSSNPARQAEARPPHNPFSTGWKNKLARFIHSYESGQWAICDKWAKTYQEEVQEHYNTFGQPPQTGKPVWIQKTSWLMEAYLKGNWNRCSSLIEWHPGQNLFAGPLCCRPWVASVMHFTAKVHQRATPQGAHSQPCPRRWHP